MREYARTYVHGLAGMVLTGLAVFVLFVLFVAAGARGGETDTLPRAPSEGRPAEPSARRVPDLRKGDKWPAYERVKVGEVVCIDRQGRKVMQGDGFRYVPGWTSPLAGLAPGPQPDGGFVLGAGDPSEPLPAEWQSKTPEGRSYDEAYRQSALAFKRSGLDPATNMWIPDIPPIVAWREWESQHEHWRKEGTRSFQDGVEEDLSPTPPPDGATEADWAEYRRRVSAAPKQAADAARKDRDTYADLATRYQKATGQKAPPYRPPAQRAAPASTGNRFLDELIEAARQSGQVKHRVGTGVDGIEYAYEASPDGSLRQQPTGRQQAATPRPEVAVVPQARTFRSGQPVWHEGHRCPNCNYESPDGEGTWVIRGGNPSGVHVHECPRCHQRWTHAR